MEFPAHAKLLLAFSLLSYSSIKSGSRFRALAVMPLRHVVLINLGVVEVLQPVRQRGPTRAWFAPLSLKEACLLPRSEDHIAPAMVSAAMRRSWSGQANTV